MRLFRVSPRRAGALLALLLCLCLSATVNAQAPDGVPKGLSGLGFTYQGQLRNAGSLVNTLCDLQFSLWDAEDLGNQIGTTEEQTGVVVSNGLFSVQLNQTAAFGTTAMNGMPRWLSIGVKCAGDAGYTELSPRQPLTPSPYAFALPGVVPGPFTASTNQGNSAGSFSLAAGRRAKANNTGSLVWADSTNADFSSTADNQIAFRAANGMLIANDAGSSKVVPVGTRYRDNAIVAWARVTATGALDASFNVASVSKTSTGVYRLTLNSSLSSGFSLIPSVIPEIDAAPTTAAGLRIASVNLVAAGVEFDVFINNGSGTLVDNDFQVIVTGR